MGFFTSSSSESGTVLDTTMRQICFPSLGRQYSPDKAKHIGSTQFKRYEYILYLMAQVSRIVYCDTGVMWSVIQTALGLSNDIVNKAITVYDKKFASLARQPTPSPPGINGRPMQSYTVPPSTGPRIEFGTYISTAEDVTCLFLDTSAVKANSNSIFTQNDIIISFKGSSTIQNFIDDAKSMKPIDFSQALTALNLTVPGLGNVAGGFVHPLLRAFQSLQTALTQRLQGKQSSRIFITGHSLGGAYATLFAWILALMKKQSAGVLQSVQSMHIITFGAPLLFSDTARNQFNALLDDGSLTLDRVVSQQVASIKTAVAGTLGKMASGADFIPTIPPGFSHPGYQPLITEMFPEKNGRPYGMQNIRALYGVESPQRYRDVSTWPFDESLELGNIASRKNLNQVVAELTQTSVADVSAIENKTNTIMNVPSIPNTQQTGGVLGFGEEKNKYEQLTKQRMPNFVSVVGSKWAISFPHAEYLGMFFLGAMRLAGRKNPGFPGHTATFQLSTTGVDIGYNFKYTPAAQPISTGGRRRHSTRKARKSKKRTYRKY